MNRTLKAIEKIRRDIKDDSFLISNYLTLHEETNEILSDSFYDREVIEFTEKVLFILSERIKYSRCTKFDKNIKDNCEDLAINCEHCLKHNKKCLVS